MNSPETPPEERPALRALLRQPDFLRLWLVGAFANAMRWLELLASGLFAYEVTGSALAVTGVVAARQLPQLFLGAFAGAVSEAVDRKLIVMLALLVPASVSTVLATLATTGHLQLWHVALGNLAAGTMWATEMSTRRRMVGEAAGPLIIPAIALDSATNAATRMIGPLLGGFAFEWLGMKGAYTVTALVQFLGAFAMAGLVYHQMTRRLALARIPADIVEGLRFARTKPLILLVYGVTIVTNAFAFSYSGLVAPLGRIEGGIAVARVERPIAEEPEERSVNVVGPRASDGVDHTTRCTSELGHITGADHLEFLHGILRNLRADARPAGSLLVILIGGVVAVREEGAAQGHSAERNQAEDPVGGHTGRKQRERIEPAPIDGQIHDLPAADRAGDFGLGFVHAHGRGGHLNLGARRGDGEIHIYAHVLSDLDADFVAFPGGKSGGRNGNRVAGAWRNRRCAELSRIIRFDGPGESIGRVRDFDLGSRNRCASWILYLAEDGPLTGSRLPINA